MAAVKTQVDQLVSQVEFPPIQQEVAGRSSSASALPPKSTIEQFLRFAAQTYGGPGLGHIAQGLNKIGHGDAVAGSASLAFGALSMRVPAAKVATAAELASWTAFQPVCMDLVRASLGSGQLKLVDGGAALIQSLEKAFDAVRASPDSIGVAENFRKSLEILQQGTSGEIIRWSLSRIFTLLEEDSLAIWKALHP